MALKAKLFDPADYLTDDESIFEYLRLALEENDPHEIVRSLSDVARARGGVSQLAKETGLSSEVLETSLSKTGNPDLATLMRILQVFGIKLTVSNAVSEPVAA